MILNAALVFDALEVKASRFKGQATEIFVCVSVLVNPDSRDCSLMLFAGSAALHEVAGTLCLSMPVYGAEARISDTELQPST